MAVSDGKIVCEASSFNDCITPYKCQSGVGQIGQYFSDGEYSNYLFYESFKSFNNLLQEQNPTLYSEKQLEIYRYVQSLHKDGLGYRRIAKFLNEKGLTTEEGHLWKNTNVYSLLKRYSERQPRFKFRRKKYTFVLGRMLMEFTIKSIYPARNILFKVLMEVFFNSFHFFWLLIIVSAPSINCFASAR